MSAIEALPPMERRTAERLSPASSLRVTVGRGTGSVIDISRGGMRVRHTGLATRGAKLRVAFEWQNERFDATAEVLSSRVAGLGDGSSIGTMFETRLRFANLREISNALLDQVLSAIRNRELRRWVANLRGWADDVRHDEGSTDGAFIRCRIIGIRWRTTWTQDSKQPENGFVVPATIRA